MVTTMILLLLLLAGGFVWHRSPDFAGSTSGGVFAVLGASLMVLGSLIYSVVRRTPPLRRVIGAHLSMRALLNAHVYTCIVGAFLALIHTGHKFQSVLGIALTIVMFCVVLTGYIGRYFLGFIGEDLREKSELLSRLRAQLEAQVPSLASAAIVDRAESSGPPLRTIEAMADVEYSVVMEARIRSFFRLWLALHIALSMLLYALLALHVWAGLEFGLRWFR